MVASFAYSCKQSMRMVMFVNKYFSTISENEVKSKKLSEYINLNLISACFRLGICSVAFVVPIRSRRRFVHIAISILVLKKNVHESPLYILFFLQKRIFDGNGRSRSVLLLLCKAQYKSRGSNGYRYN